MFWLRGGGKFFMLRVRVCRARGNISAEIEVTANPTTEVPYHSNWEVDSLKRVVFQNRMALDIITAPMGGYVP